jgi:tRNA threonylcarbamoyladenosine biosynthesis protein TsaB
MDAIAVSIGPGSFTGLRIGLSFAKGLAFSKDLPIIPISTMMSLAFTLKEDLPVIGIIHSHAKRVFCQNIRWNQRIPYPDGDIRVAEWEELLEEIDYSKKTFQLNCDSLKKGNFFISSKLSSTSVGLLAGINFEKLVIDKPFDLVPNYVSPFMVGQKK